MSGFIVTMRLSVRVFLHGLCDEMVKSSLRLYSLCFRFWVFVKFSFFFSYW